MSAMDVFRGDAFSAASLTAALDKFDYVPGLLGSIGAFQSVPVRSEVVWIEERSDSPFLIQTTPRRRAPAPRSPATRHHGPAPSAPSASPRPRILRGRRASVRAPLRQ